MARAIWTGSITFGLVNVPVKLYTATEEKDVRFHQFQRQSNRRVHNKRVAEGSDKDVAYDDIVKGYEARKGEFVIVTPDELEAIAPGRSRTIDIEDFVELRDIDPVYFNRAYYVGPADDAAGRTYRLLVGAMNDTGKAAIGRFVMRTKEYLAAIRPTASNYLVLETLYFADEVRDPASVVGALPKARVGERELTIARQLIESMASGWDPKRYADTYRERVLDLVERKAKGEEIVTEEPEERAPVLDLMAALEQSLESARQHGGARSSGAKRAPVGAKAGGKTTGRKAAPSKRTRAKDDYDDWPRRRLEDEARRRDIPGRSKMNRDELVQALRKAS
ncbi:MAG: Ku protein [Actinobacteria bacterium]|nr:Ku protein [Actinomycetota bacterium]